MCHLWEGRIKKCQHCSVTEYYRLFNSLLDGEPTRLTHLQVAPMAQNQPSRGNPQPSSHGFHVNQDGNATVRNFCDREQAATHYSQPSASSHNAPSNQTTQRKHERTDTDQPSSSRHDALSSGTVQYKRQRMDPKHSSTLRLESRINEQRQRARQGKTTDRAVSMRQGTGVHEAAPSGQQLQGNHQFVSSRCDRRGSYQDLPSASRHYKATGSTGEDQHPTSDEIASQNHPRTEDIEQLITETNELQPPCWEDKWIFFPQIQEESAYERYFRHREEQMNKIWGPYEKEREALAAPHTPELEEIWTPTAEEEMEEGVLEGEIPRWDEIWEGSVLQGEECMRDILGEDETWPREASEEVGVWTRESGGMLNSADLKQLLRVFTLEELRRE